ncbi:MAG: hypothetical protein EOO27_42500 [Comamonadaceae bacterium]|nr:MAG: hypothetical protein EOO27_42500 [Comamonadaceae bacterium]
MVAREVFVRGLAGSAFLVIVHRFYNAVELSLTVVLSVVIAPRLRATWPDAPDLLWEILTPFVVVLGMALASLLLWQRPRITAVWKEKSGPPLENLRVELNPSLSSRAYEVTFGGAPKGLLSQLLMWCLRSWGMRIVVHVPGAPISMNVLYSSRDEHGESVATSDFHNGVALRVISPPNPHIWLMLETSFDAETSMNEQPYKISHGTHAHRLIVRLLARLVKVSSDTQKATFY